MPLLTTGAGAYRAAAGGSTVTFDPATKSSHITLSGGNLISTSGSGSTNGTNARSTTSHSTGKYYVEFTLTTKVGGAGFQSVGICNSSFVADSGGYLGSDASKGGGYYSDGSGPGLSGIAGTAYVQADVISMAVDTGAKLIWFRKNGASWFGTAVGDPAAGTNGVDISAITGALFAIAEGEANGDVWTVNFGGSAYAQSVPSGYGNW